MKKNQNPNEFNFFKPRFSWFIYTWWKLEDLYIQLKIKMSS